MNIQQLLDLGDGVAELSDSVLEAHLRKYFPQTRATTLAEEVDDELQLPEFMRAEMGEEKPDDGIILL